MPQDHRRPRRGADGHRLRRNSYRPTVIELEPRRLLSAYVVDDSSDLPLDPGKGPGETVNGTITVRSAIQQVNIDGSGSIGFAFPMSITTSGLPVVTANGVTIDGGSLGSVVVEGNGDGASGLVLAGDDADITGLEIVNFGGDGIDVGATGATIGGTAAGAGNAIFGNVHLGLGLGSFGGSALVQGNFIGTDAEGTAGLGNGESGIYIGSAGNTIGGSSAAARNVISGNAADGVNIAGTGATGNVVAGDFVGTNPVGSAALANYVGVEIEGGASDNLIGTNGDGVNDGGGRNVISGNATNGVVITGAGTSGNLVAGNYLGTNAAGTSAVGNGQAGVRLASGATDNTVGGTTTAARNVIGGNGNRGVYISTPAGSTSPTTGNVVEGNYIGTDASGLVPMGNNINDAVSIDLSPGNTIGGTVAGAGNVLDGGDDTGVFIYGDYQSGPYASAAGNLIAGNIIGLAADGETAAGFGNQYDGIVIDSAPDTTIGGTVAAARNIISNNTNNQGAGILITNFEEPDGSYGTVVQGNYIGTDITGTKELGNDIGVDIEGASSALIGMTGQDGTIGIPGGNLISGNLTAGIIINAASANVGGSTSIPGAADNIVAGNLIGTTADGTQALGNTGDGVLIEGGATGNTIGGTSAGAGNLIAFNAGDGVGVGLGVDDASLDNPILENSIFSNAGLGIDVNNSAPQAAPALGIAVSSGSQTTITGTVTGARNTTFLIEFFSNPAGTDQGETYLGSVNVTTTKRGVASFTFTPASIVAAGLNFTATATDPGGNTSEFSAPATVQTPPVDVTSDLSVRSLPVIFNRRTGLYTQKLIITNISDAPLAGPIELVLLDLKNATLVNQSGTTNGNPYLTILRSGSLGIGQSLTVTLIFADPTGTPITYVPEFLAGPIPPPDDGD